MVTGSRIFTALALCIATITAQAAGFRLIEVPARGDNPAIPGAMWYPCSKPPTDVNLGPLTIPGAKDCDVTGSRLPLVVISHGNLGAFFDHHDTAAALADAGFVVAAITHRGDSIPILADAADPSVMLARPEDMQRLIDFMLDASPAASVIDSKRIGFFGFSAGATTGLVLAGASPDWPAMMCRFSTAFSACAGLIKKNFRELPRRPELRIRAAVLADPAPWLKAKSFAPVKMPIQLWASENGGRAYSNGRIAVMPEGVALINKSLPGRHEFHVVPNTGHFAFLLCGPSIKPIPEYCGDAPGFDRAASHQEFNQEVVRFFRTQLVD
jgi:predicted dienelactone hydrolase